MDDALGVLLFSLTVSIAMLFVGGEASIGHELLVALREIGLAVVLGVASGLGLLGFGRLFLGKGEGQWIVIVSSALLLCRGMADYVGADSVLAHLVMGITIVNAGSSSEEIFSVIERYTEDLVFLIFFVLSGMQLDVFAMSSALSFVAVFVGLRVLGKVLGVMAGARLTKGSTSVRRYTAGGLVPQGGVVIGLVLVIINENTFNEVSQILLATVMGGVVVNEIVGPLLARASLKQAGEIPD